jgi:hypothetical protein
MKNQIKHAESKVQCLLYACANCHRSMKPYYQQQYSEWNKILTNLKNNNN